MPDNFLSLLDLAKRRGTDAAVGLVEEVVTFAPELEKIMGRSIPGTYYNARVRTAYTANAAFRKANAGVSVGASSFDQKRFNCFFFDAQLRVDEAVARASEGDGDSLALVQADEAVGAIRAKAILLGKQFYMGSLNDPNGPPGLADFMTTQAAVTDPLTGSAIDQTENAAGSSMSGTAERVWAIFMHQQGIHWLWGADQAIDIKPWMLQQVDDQNGAKLMAWVTNTSGFIGTSCAHIRAVGTIKNLICGIDGSGATPLTDTLIARLEAKFPVGIQPNMFLMSRRARASLQQSRSVTIFANAQNATTENSGGAALMAPLPTMTASGVPIVVTDSIPQENSF